MEDTIDIICETEKVHEGDVSYVLEKMPEDEKLLDLAELFKVFSDSTRTKILSALFIKSLCVCDIARIVNMTKSAISHQLRILRNTKLVKYERKGKEIFYSLDDEHIYKIFQMGLEHLNEK